MAKIINPHNNTEPLPSSIDCLNLILFSSKVILLLKDIFNKYIFFADKKLTDFIDVDNKKVLLLCRHGHPFLYRRTGSGGTPLQQELSPISFLLHTS